MKTFLEILGLIILTAPLVWELRNDRTGDDHLIQIGFGWTIPSKSLDVFWRVGIAVLVAWLNNLITGRGFWPALGLSGGMHLMVFDYGVAYILKKNGVIAVSAHWFSYLGTKGFDTIKWWRNRSPFVRLLIRAGVFGLTTLIYFY